MADEKEGNPEARIRYSRDADSVELPNTGTGWVWVSAEDVRIAGEAMPQGLVDVYIYFDRGNEELISQLITVEGGAMSASGIRHSLPFMRGLPSELVPQVSALSEKLGLSLSFKAHIGPELREVVFFSGMKGMGKWPVSAHVWNTRRAGARIYHQDFAPEEVKEAVDGFLAIDLSGFTFGEKTGWAPDEEQIEILSKAVREANESVVELRAKLSGLFEQWEDSDEGAAV